MASSPFGSAGGPGSFVAYNDVVPLGAKPHSGQCFWNQISHGRGAPELQSGELLDHGHHPTGVMLHFEEHTTHSDKTINYARDAGPVVGCTAASDAFAACMCSESENCTSEECGKDCNCDAFDGNLSYNDEPGWFLRYVLSGLNPACSATLTLFVHRGPGNGGGTDDYLSRYSLFTLEDAVAFEADVANALEALDSGATLVLRGGSNVAGHVARWTNVVPGQDGNISVVASHDREGRLEGNPKIWPKPHPYKAYSGGLLKLEQHCPQPDPDTSGASGSDETLPVTGLVLVVGVLALLVVALLVVLLVVCYKVRRRSFQQQDQRNGENEVLSNDVVIIGQPAGDRALDSSAVAHGVVFIPEGGEGSAVAVAAGKESPAPQTKDDQPGLTHKSGGGIATVVAGAPLATAERPTS